MRDELGSPAAAQLCNRLRPSYWFSAHYHVKFPALIHHSKSMSEHTVTAREGESEKVGQQQEGHTKFLALDKCLPRREYLQVWREVVLFSCHYISHQSIDKGGPYLLLSSFSLFLRFWIFQIQKAQRSSSMTWNGLRYSRSCTQRCHWSVGRFHAKRMSHLAKVWITEVFCFFCFFHSIQVKLYLQDISFVFLNFILTWFRCKRRRDCMGNAEIGWNKQSHHSGESHVDFSLFVSSLPFAPTRLFFSLQNVLTLFHLPSSTISSL